MEAPVTVLYFYRTRWGAHDEFVALFRKNHWPILREQLTAGRFTAVEMSTPRFHGDGRADWDVLVSITFRDWDAMEEHTDAQSSWPMKPFSGEKAPLVSSSRSHSWRGVRSHDGHPIDSALSSAARAGETMRSTSAPPCARIR